MVIIVATQNKHKIEEIESITKQFGMEVISREEAGIPDFEIVEDGDTFEANSEKKARVIMEYTGKTTIADDSGIVVDALDGAPGVYSARFAGVEGEGADRENNGKLVRLLKDIPAEERTAKFVSVITMIYPDGKKIVARGECPGRIIDEERGDGGFGYDPLFVPDGFTKTYAQLTAEEKNRVSHRGKALEKLREQLQSMK
ncbi:MAG: XTP/dITP diphosphatase [Anaerovorax sp.]